MYRSLLVPLDGSSFAEQALPFALSIAQRAAARLQVATVVPHSWNSFLHSEPASTHLTDAWRSYLERVVERIRRSNVPVSYVVLEGEKVAPALCAHAEQTGVDLVVMNTHGRGTMGRLWFGSVAYEVVHHVSAPLLLLRHDDYSTEWEKEPGLQHMLVTLDGSPLAERVLEPAIALGTLMDAEYTLLRVINDIPLGTPELDSISLSSPAPELLDEIQIVQERVQNEAQNHLEGVAERLRARGLKVQTRVIAANDPGIAILHALASPSTDLVALEMRGDRGSPARGLFGSVARKVIHGTSKPVFVQSAAAVPLHENALQYQIVGRPEGR